MLRQKLQFVWTRYSWLLRKGSSLSGIWKQNTSLHFYLLHLFFQFPFRTFLPLEFVHCSWLLQVAPSWPASSHFAHVAEFFFACSRTMAVFLVVETAKRIRNIRVHRDHHITGCDVFRRFRRSKRQYHRIGATSAVSVSDVNNHGIGHSLWMQFLDDFPDAAAGNVFRADNSSANLSDLWDWP